MSKPKEPHRLPRPNRRRKPFSMRVTDERLAKYKAWADANQRSISEELEFRIEVAVLFDRLSNGEHGSSLLLPERTQRDAI